ncbi:hypothetical protein HETIRDRAFT_119492 [Heterobasidion irregulare TC 32-1]|uniref:Uncharacterized protein n=1 Tax=Heterobasidion irregulare (strain TC 32-1) TaxID=747525 RepID=W4KAA7_HETIT|nr:uncharacterized protein HETIRDRAFT_119492 [Heterobasidion irregulare TC 32-1]ETW82718.1 hypothetical protein HETIRDRAFT_119492 [Heterobasidion irregulare TC 32-1]
MKKPAARDFKDLIQCAIPCFDSLLPAPHHAIVMDLLFALGIWHAYAKLWLHTNSTLTSLELATTALSQHMRKFKATTCASYETMELPGEETRHPGKQRKDFNISTYKNHTLGHYAKTIRLFGTIDLYTSQVGELQHRHSKHCFKRTNKNRFTKQLAQHESRERVLHKVNERMMASSQPLPAPAGKKLAARGDALLCTRPEMHHHIARSVKEYDYITPWLTKNLGDPALKLFFLEEFLPRLRDYLLARLLGKIWDGDEHSFTDAEGRQILFDNDHLYRHSTVQINYTTYDLRRAQDSINTHSHADIMLLSHEDDGDATPPHPYWYARVIGIYHVFVMHPTLSPEPRRLDFLWVRWFGRDMGSPSGWAARPLHRVGFVDSNDPSAFGFVNPQDHLQNCRSMATDDDA